MASSDTNSEPPVKRQKVSEPRTLLKDLPADQFLKHAALWQSPAVSIMVHGTEIIVPKDLLCYNSSYFNSAFNGRFKEGEEQKLHFHDCSADTFQMAVQWIYFSQIKVPTCQVSVQEAPATAKLNMSQNGTQTSCTAKQAKPTTPSQSRQSSVASNEIDTNLRAWAMDENLDIQFYPDFAANDKAQTVSRLLAFLKLADKIDLIGPFDSVIASIKQVISSSPGRRALMPGHIRLAAELSPTHPIRKLFADACFREFVQDLIPGTNVQGKPFRFDKELSEFDSFSSDLLRSYRQSEKKKVTNKKTGPEFSFTDPFTESKFSITI
ncbi:hypothetical protein IFR04_000983 [Cadophora malorum]|uniref:BTB domain-containing protein n=1 Tax=Cadophora malorum TaxID=108018 RepID=A0A8H7WJA6_9HELO|nr:hypothetical protein IFR04_000983 [Cadophora malorum]